MNPKSVNDLDPKLKETYERVMGTSFAPATPTPQNRPIQTTVVEQPVTEQNPLSNPQPMAHIPEQPSIVPTPEMVSSPQMTKIKDPFKESVTPPANVLIKNATTKKKKSLMPVLLLVGGIIFFIAYGVIWAKIFGLF